MASNDRKIMSSYNKFIAPINKSIQTYLANSSVPMFQSLKKMSLDVYCYNYKLLEKTFGKNMVLLNNLVYDCLVESIVNSIYRGFNADENSVGWWTKATLTDLVRRTSAFCPAGDTEELYYVSYGFGAIDENTLNTLLEDEKTNDKCTIRLMAFSDFSYAKFNQVTNQIIDNVVTTINEMIPSVWPTVYHVRDDETVEDRLMDLFDQSVSTAKDQNSTGDDEVDTLSWFTASLTLFVSSALTDGGASLEAVQDVLRKTTYRFWKMPTKGKAKDALTYGIMYSNISENEDSEERGVCVVAEFTDTQINSLLSHDFDNLSNTNKNAIHKKLKKFINDFCSYLVATIAA